MYQRMDEPTSFHHTFQNHWQTDCLSVCLSVCLHHDVNRPFITVNSLKYQSIFWTDVMTNAPANRGIKVNNTSLPCQCDCTQSLCTIVCVCVCVCEHVDNGSSCQWAPVELAPKQRCDFITPPASCCRTCVGIQASTHSIEIENDHEIWFCVCVCVCVCAGGRGWGGGSRGHPDHRHP